MTFVQYKSIAPVKLIHAKSTLSVAMIGSDTLVTPELFTVLLDVRVAAVNGALLHQGSRGRPRLEVGALAMVPMQST